MTPPVLIPLVVASALFMENMDSTVIATSLPAIAVDLHGFGHLSWIVSAYLLTSTAAMPITSS